MRQGSLPWVFAFVTLAMAACTRPPTIADARGESARTVAPGEFGVSRPAPLFSEPDLGRDRIVALKDYQGKVVILNFWATWCLPCREEVPALEALQNTYEGDLVVIGAAVFSSLVDAERFAHDYGVHYPMIMGSYELMAQYGNVRAVPTTIIVDRNGLVAHQLVGSRTRAELEELLTPLIAM